MSKAGPSTLGEIVKRLDDRRPASGMDHLDHAEALGRLLAEMDGVSMDVDVLLRDGARPVEQRYWQKACAAYSFLLGVDLEEIVAAEAAPTSGR